MRTSRWLIQRNLIKRFSCVKSCDKNFCKQFIFVHIFVLEFAVVVLVVVFVILIDIFAVIVVVLIFLLTGAGVQLRRLTALPPHVPYPPPSVRQLLYSDILDVRLVMSLSINDHSTS